MYITEIMCYDGIQLNYYTKLNLTMIINQYVKDKQKLYLINNYSFSLHLQQLYNYWHNGTIRMRI